MVIARQTVGKQTVRVVTIPIIIVIGIIIGNGDHIGWGDHTTLGKALSQTNNSIKSCKDWRVQTEAKPVDAC